MYSIASQPPQECPEQVHSVEPQRRAHDVDLPGEPLYDPARGIIGLIRASAAELVVEHDRTVDRQIGE
jgi:hypothetical protein